MNLQQLGGQWFALHVKTRFENTCARILRNKGYDEFLPRCPAPGRLGDAPPLFPGYLFCRLNGNATGLVVTTPGVIRIVGCGGIPTPITDVEISYIRAVVASGHLAYQCPYLRVGEPVRIARGPLRGVTGLLAQVKNARRLVVSLHAAMLSAAVEVDLESVVYIGAAGIPPTMRPPELIACSPQA